MTDESGGNALGVGQAHLITKKVYDKIDLKLTYTNTITATFLDRARIPMTVDTEKEAFEIAHKTIYNLPGETARSCDNQKHPQVGRAVRLGADLAGDQGPARHGARGRLARA